MAQRCPRNTSGDAFYLGIRAETKHQKKDRERKARDPYPNLIFSTWRRSIARAR